MVVLGVENGGAGFESLAGDGHSGHPTADHAMAFEHSDPLYSRGVLAEEMSNGGSTDAAPDYANSSRTGVHLNF